MFDQLRRVLITSYTGVRMHISRISGLIVVVLSLARPAFAQNVTIDPATTNPEQLGFQTTYDVTNFLMTFPGHGVQVQIRENDANCVSAWFNVPSTVVNNNLNTFALTYRTPGTFNIQVTVTYQPQSNPLAPPPPPPVVVTRNVTIANPTCKLTSGAGVNTGFTMVQPTAGNLNGATGTDLYFDLSSAGKPVGLANSLSVQEQITNIIVQGQPQPMQPWAPPVGTADTRFQMATDPNTKILSIRDFKYFYSAGKAPPVGVFSTYTQENRAVWTDFCGNQQTCSLGTFNFAVDVINATTWQTNINN